MVDGVLIYRVCLFKSSCHFLPLLFHTLVLNQNKYKSYKYLPFQQAHSTVVII